jgi:uncharacterized OB-fold protein
MTEVSTDARLGLGGWTVPVLDATNRAWFTSGALTLQQCDRCDTLQHPPEEVCHACGGTDFSGHDVAPSGTLYSYTVVHHSVHPALDAAVPYVVALVSLDDVPAVRVVGNLLGVPIDDIVIGMPVVATWEELVSEDGTVVQLPQWARATTKTTQAVEGKQP